eukprot:TRINITY_DN72909_c0_g1_i1.p1 TRINITY_DN72909_c0_g1~~TRINITY_DN72909_c0_g1_i1.p1  ORF type:complete len:188 (+),score=33.31 TRINITY_DN72909_c0_g1_i1:25-564(+)
MPASASINPWQRDKQWQFRINSEAFWRDFPQSGGSPPEIWSAGLIPIQCSDVFQDVARTSKGSVKDAGASRAPGATGSREGSRLNTAGTLLQFQAPHEGQASLLGSPPRTPRSSVAARSLNGSLSARAAGSLLMDAGGRHANGSTAGSLKAEIEKERQRREALEKKAVELRGKLDAKQS